MSKPLIVGGEKGRLLGLVTLTDLSRFQLQMIKILKKNFAIGLSSRRMDKVIDYYVV